MIRGFVSIFNKKSTLCLWGTKGMKGKHEFENYEGRILSFEMLEDETLT